MSNHLQRRQADPAYRATITIGLLPTGQVQVKGPLHMTQLCEQMFNEAFNVFKAYRVDVEPPGSSIITTLQTKIVAPN